MDKEYFDALAKVRLDRARELIEEAKDLLEKGSYKSANNRAFYAIEKSLKALLATKETEVATHNGSLKQFTIFLSIREMVLFRRKIIKWLQKQEQISKRFQIMMIFMWQARKKPNNR